MRKKVIAGNWKMHNDINESEILINSLKQLLKGKSVNCDVIICPPFTSLTEASKLD
jgi:triosephosphate isomerase (TIM)